MDKGLSNSVVKPTAVITEEILSLLESNSFYSTTFKELTGAQVPWSISPSAIQNIQEKFGEIETILHTAYPDQVILCFVAEKGAFWLMEDRINFLFEHLDRQSNQIYSHGVLPVWKLTASEMISIILKNFRRQVLSAAYDYFMLKKIKPLLGPQYKFVSREFANFEKRLFLLMEQVKSYLPRLYISLLESCILYERCLITQEMFNRLEITQESIGYSMEKLEMARERLQDKCSRIHPKCLHEIMMIRGFIESTYRDSEAVQLGRFSQWEFTFNLTDHLPPDIQYHEKLISTEKDSLDRLVSQRVEELGVSAIVKEIMNIEELNSEYQVRQFLDAEMTNPFGSQPKRRKSDSIRMAFLERRKMYQ